jgi:hypothetical protein
MNKEDLIIQIVHIFLIGIFLIYVGIMIPDYDWIYYILLSFGIIAILFFFININNQDLFWIIWRIFIIGIILIWIGIQKYNSPKFLFKLLIILGAGAIGYHLIKLIQNIKN